MLPVWSPVFVELVNNNLQPGGQFLLQGHVTYINTAVHGCWCVCVLCYVFQFLGTFTRLWKVIISFVMSVCVSVCLHGATRLPLDGFS